MIDSGINTSYLIDFKAENLVPNSFKSSKIPEAIILATLGSLMGLEVKYQRLQLDNNPSRQEIPA